MSKKHTKKLRVILINFHQSSQLFRLTNVVLIRIEHILWKAVNIEKTLAQKLPRNTDESQYYLPYPEIKSRFSRRTERIINLRVHSQCYY